MIAAGQRGAEQLGDLTAPANVVSDHVDQYLAYMLALPMTRAEVESDAGVRTTVETVVLRLAGVQQFEFAKILATYEPTVIARVGDVAVHGMLSPNYDAHGHSALPTIKVIPLNEPLIHGRSGLPDAGGVAMLGGAVSLERPGVGSHDNVVGQEIEHRTTSLGAISLGRPEIALGHAQHNVRKKGSSVATGLSNGTLGALFQPTLRTDFQGYGEPIIISDTNRAQAEILIPKSYIDHPDQAFGAMVTVDTTRVMIGNGIVNLVAQAGESAVADAETLSRAI